MMSTLCFKVGVDPNVDRVTLMFMFNLNEHDLHLL